MPEKEVFILTLKLLLVKPKLLVLRDITVIEPIVVTNTPCHVFVYDLSI